MPPLWLALVLVTTPGQERPKAPVEPPGDPSAVVVTGTADPRLEPFDRLMREFLARHRAPGAALAVARQGKLVYARGFGVADRATGAPVPPDALFRVASLSKPVTAAAVLALVDRGRLRLDDQAIDRLPPPLRREAPADPRWRRVTVRELLQHRGGWDRDRSFDPMFRPLVIAREVGGAPPAGPRQVIRYMLRQPLDFDPGARMAYSNFGYCVLGRVVEQATGESYERAVRRLVLDPLGIPAASMRLGKTLPAGRAPGEVAYHQAGPPVGSVFPPHVGRPVPSPYGGWHLEAMDAHGGWLASAPALVKFAAAFDDPEHCPVLQPGSVRAQFERPPGAAGSEAGGRPKPVYYACGWNVRVVGPRRVNTWHTGSLPGTATLLVRRHDGLTWAVLFNARDGRDGTYLAGAIDPLVHDAADAVRDWPETDLFPRHLQDTPRR